MTDREIVRMALKERKVSQKSLAEMMGMRSSANVSQMLRPKGNGMLTTNFVKALNTLDYAVVIRDIHDSNKEVYMTPAGDEKVENRPNQTENSAIECYASLFNLVNIIINSGNADVIQYLSENPSYAKLIRRCREMTIPAEELDRFLAEKTKATGDQISQAYEVYKKRTA